MRHHWLARSSPFILFGFIFDKDTWQIAQNDNGTTQAHFQGKRCIYKTILTLHKCRLDIYDSSRDTNGSTFIDLRVAFYKIFDKNTCQGAKKALRRPIVKIADFIQGGLF